MDFMEFDRKRAEDAQVEKLHRQMVDIQDTMIEQSMLRKKLENLMDAESSRSEMALERVSSRNVALQDELDKRFGSDHRSASRSPAGRNSSNNNKVLDQVMSLRTKEFQKSQAHKANNIHHLAQERQRILEARNRLQEKKERLRVLPSPVGKETFKHWGRKYSLFSPLPYSGGSRLYTPIHLQSNWGTSLPVYEKHYYTYFPRKRHGNIPTKKRNVVYVPTPLYQSSFF